MATDIGINKYVLKLSPLQPEFRRGMLHAVNPVGVVAFAAASGLSIAMYFHALGDTLQPYSPVAAAVIAFVLTPLMAFGTKGRYYLRRTDDGINEPLLDAEGNPSSTTYNCHVCHQPYERPDLTACATHDAVVCSPCLSTEKVGDDIPRSERSLLTAYGALSGYGMRASRAMGWLAAAMLVTIVLLMGFGLPRCWPGSPSTASPPPASCVGCCDRTARGS